MSGQQGETFGFVSIYWKETMESSSLRFDLAELEEQD